MYGHTWALLPKCDTHPERRAVLVDAHRLLCFECAQPLLDPSASTPDAPTTMPKEATR